ncbi:tetratricopeptide repeat protein [Sphingosinicella sp. LHD-64]|uniref:tetratricopeptide repeat protein n=1 Tax=Sphingosinicella sp. LHD-64 TaxID=3072139 RepID=UPI00280E76FC|nr:tetratricopeptide repeat protein [Sphingosinicella sp. LHD-64]MDQ8755951.1 tetratricopeptide repeat protein [Sphingosinicella sp. LHD-64]
MRFTKAIQLLLAVGATALSAEASADATLRSPLVPGQSCLDPAAPGAGPEATRPPPVLVDGLGYAGLEPDSANPEARAWFAQGVRLVWAFDEAEAIRAFQEAQRRDPGCALCVFGEAWARGPTINLQPRTEELEAARAAARRALALSQRLSPRDRLLVEGMALRTRDGDGFSNEAYARFMEGAAQRMPEDDMLAILAADARMVISRSMRPGSLSQRLLERVLARNPDHGGAIHFYIHLTDWTDEQHLAEPYADRLARIAPAASHLVHMPSHTFYGVGRYRDAAATNVAAVAADRAYVERVRPPRSDYRFYLNRHNMHFAIESALARGDAQTATEMSRQYREVYLGENAEQGSRVLGSATWYTQGLHDEINGVLAVPEQTAAIDRVLRHYARGEALTRRGDGTAVAAEAAGIAALRNGAAAPELGDSGAKLAEVLQHVLEGRAAMLENRYAAAETAYRRAMQAQLRADFGFDPPLFWYSARRSLAAALLARGDARGARRQLEASLRHWPNDPLALYALSQAERALGNAGAAEASLARARSIWAGNLADLPLARL